jgi:hypothetical protein
MAINWPSKDPDEVLDYRWNIKLDEGDTIASATITKTDGDVAVGNQTSDQTGVTVWLSGGSDGTTSTFRGVATTTGGRTIEETLYLPIVATDESLVGQLRAAFPAFASVATSAITFWLTRAARVVDDSWPAGDRDYAQMLLAAHLMTTNGLGTGAESEGFAAGTTGFSRIRSGTLELERPQSAAAQTGYMATTYGRQFAELLRMAKGGARVTGGSTAGADGAPDIRLGFWPQLPRW